MDEICKGQCVRIKSADEIETEYGYSIEDFQDGDITIGDIRIHPDMTEHFGHFYTVREIDHYDNSLYLGAENDYWWPFELVEVVSKPGELFGFKVGDQVEFLDYTEIERVDDWFVRDMRYLCGTTGTITSISPESSSFARIEMIDKDGMEIPWNLNTRMIDHVDTSPDIVVDDWFSVMNQ